MDVVHTALLLVVLLQRAVAVEFPHDAVIDLHQRRGCVQFAEVCVTNVAGVQAEQTAPV